MHKLHPHKAKTTGVNGYLKLVMMVFGVALFINPCYLTAQKKKDPYINDDSTDIFSTHPSRPFKYGYAYTKDECKHEFEEYISDFDLKKGDVIADVGAASGWIAGALSVLVDSITFFVEDVDTHYLNESQFGKVLEHYSKVRETPQTNKFHFIIGRERETNLPDSTFDKIIVNNAFHEMNYVWDMINDMSYKIKEGGKIMVREGFSNKYRIKRLKGCNIKGYKVSDVVKYFGWLGFYLTNMTDPENSFHNHLTFEKSQERSDSFLTRKKSVETYIQKLDRLNEKKISKDSIKTNEIANYLKQNMSAINTVYKSLETYLNSLGYEWLKAKKYQSAINIFKINVLLYPASSDSYDSLGEAYMDNKQYDLALLNYLKSVEIYPGNTNGKEAIEELKVMMNDSDY